MRLDERDIDLIVVRVTQAITNMLTEKYPPEQYGEKAKGPVDWVQWRTSLITWASIGILVFILTTIFFYLKAHF